MKLDQKRDTRELRKKGWSINSISKKLNVAKSSVSLWCKDIQLNEQQKALLIQNALKKNAKGRLIGAEMNRQKKLENIEKAETEAFYQISNLSKRDLLIASTCLFWGEGSKTGSRFIFINSDLDMVKVMLEFLYRCLNIPRKSIHITIQINLIHKPRIEKILTYWSKNLKIPLSQFGKPYYVNVRPKKEYSNYNNYYGICRLKVLRGSTIQYKMLGLINALKVAKLPV